MIANVSDAALLLSGSIELLLIVKATLLLLICLAITQIAHNARASVRHLVIASTFAALIALPGTARERAELRRTGPVEAETRNGR